jgi:hypothetical protein
VDFKTERNGKSTQTPVSDIETFYILSVIEYRYSKYYHPTVNQILQLHSYSPFAFANNYLFFHPEENANVDESISERDDLTFCDTIQGLGSSPSFSALIKKQGRKPRIRVYGIMRIHE